MAGRGHVGREFGDGRSPKPAGGSSARGETSRRRTPVKDSGKQTLPDCSKKGDDKHDDPAHPGRELYHARGASRGSIGGSIRDR